MVGRSNTPQHPRVLLVHAKKSSPELVVGQQREGGGGGVCRRRAWTCRRCHARHNPGVRGMIGGGTMKRERESE
jgi:hypothetical protein